MTLIAELATSLLAIVVFALVLYRAAIVDKFRNLSDAAARGLSAMLDSGLDDDAKEVAVQRAGLSLLAETFKAGWWIGLAFAAAAAVVYGADLLGFAGATETIALMLRVDYIVGVTVVAMVAAWLLRRRAGGAAYGKDVDAYGYGDRFFHMLAFSGAGIQRAAAWCDNKIFSGQIDRTPDRPPVFVTSLARGGTTALLNALHDIPAIATHEYRDMPFITAPLLWSRLSGAEKRRVTRRERAHDDGMEIDLHSPEAFDDVFWHLFWPEHYRETAIELWQATDVNQDARDFFRVQFRKIAILRRGERLRKGEGAVRYLSKNNANIARLRLLPIMFPDCDVIIALRRPAAHAASLFRQHRNFLRLHAEDDFIRRYMRDIGHFEFGLLHRPIRFETFDADRRSTETADYWLAYWNAAFKELMAHGEQCHIVTQDDLRMRPQETMRALASALDLDVGEMDFTRYFLSGADKQPREMFSRDLLVEADALYETLANRAIR